MPSLRRGPSGPPFNVVGEPDEILPPFYVPVTDGEGGIVYISSQELQERLIQDRFCGGALSITGTNTNANIGELGWNTVIDTSNGTVTRVPSETGHFGIVRVSSNVTNGRQTLYQANTAIGGNFFQLDDMDYIEWTVKNVQSRQRFGLGSDMTDASLGIDSIYIECSTDLTPTWRFVTRGNGSSDVIVSDIEVVPGQWITWRTKRVSASIYEFYYKLDTDSELILAGATDGSQDVPATNLLAVGLQAIRIGSQSIMDLDTFTMQLNL